MNTTLTLNLTLEQLVKVTAFLDTLGDPSEPKLPLEVQSITEAVQEPQQPHIEDMTPMLEKVPPTAGKKVSMPTFGRTKSQITEYVISEATRVEKRTKEELLKEEKRILREERKAEIAAEKQAAIDADNAANEAIKATLTTTVEPIKMPVNPFTL